MTVLNTVAERVGDVQTDDAGGMVGGVPRVGTGWVYQGSVHTHHGTG